MCSTTSLPNHDAFYGKDEIHDLIIGEQRHSRGDVTSEDIRLARKHGHVQRGWSQHGIMQEKHRDGLRFVLNGDELPCRVVPERPQDVQDLGLDRPRAWGPRDL